MTPCGHHTRTNDLAVVDAGLMVIAGLEVPQTVTFTGSSESYGEGDRERTWLVGQLALGGEMKLHLPPENE